MKKIFFLIPALMLTACNDAQQESPTSASLLFNVNIIDVRDGTILENHQMVIDSGKIVKIFKKEAAQETYKIRIDGKGSYAVPGLAEMHAHIPSPDTPRERIEETLFLYLSNGITTIRGMLGHPSHLEMREAAQNGSLLSPRIFTSSPSFNGNTVSTPADARRLVKQYKEEGYDFLKIHPGIKLEVFDTLVKTAGEVEIPFSGHVPVDVGIRHALKSRYASIDHVDGFLEGLVPESKKADPETNGFFGYNFTRLADTTLVADLVRLSRENEVWIVPTQSLFERWFAPVGTDVLLAQAEMKYMPATTLEDWKKRKEESTGPGSGFSEAQWTSFDAIRKKLIKALQENGHGILLGSDAPQLFNVPGFSIHHEIEGMLNAGLSPLEILQSGTINPARFFGRENEFGELKAGMAADLLLIKGNPLKDPAALKEVYGVMVRGLWLSKENIDKRLAEISVNALKN